jgi:hypothetical protein
MARVTYTPLAEGTTSASNADTIFTDASTQSSSLDEQNFAEEGFDYRTFETSVQSVKAFTPVEDTAGTMALTTTFAEADFGTQIDTGAVTVESDEVLIVKCYLSLLSNGSQEGVPDGGKIEIKLQYFPNGGAWTDFASSLRRRTPPSDPGGGDARMSTFFKLDGALTLDDIRLVIRDASSNDVTVQLDRVLMFGRIYKRH